ncbi:MAG: HPr family phosphocarrier protein [Pseudomonadota bacterium]
MEASVVQENSEHFTELTISNRLGLHARAAARLAAMARAFKAELYLEKNGLSADAKSVLSLLTLECPLGTRVVVRAVGPDARQAVDLAAELIDNKFGEE